MGDETVYNILQIVYLKGPLETAMLANINNYSNNDSKRTLTEMFVDEVSLTIYVYTHHMSWTTYYLVFIIFTWSVVHHLGLLTIIQENCALAIIFYSERENVPASILRVSTKN